MPDYGTLRPLVEHEERSTVGSDWREALEVGLNRAVTVWRKRRRVGRTAPESR